MAFSPTEFPNHEVLFNTFTNGSEYIATVQVGVDDDLGAIYSAFSAFSPAAGGNIEHVFCLHSAVGEEVTPLWTGAQTKLVIPDPAHRGMILNVFCLAAELLVEQANPEFIVHSAYGGNLPAKSLAKHVAIMQVIEAKGYEIAHPNEYHGRHVWFAERLPHPNG